MRMNKALINENKITDGELLKKVIMSRGITMSWLCRTAQISYHNLRSGMEGRRVFTVPEAYGISKALGLSDSERDRIFFANEVEIDTPLNVNEVV